jgi:hypothetical protein
MAETTKIGSNAGAAKKSGSADAFQFLATKNITHAAQSQQLLVDKIIAVQRAKWERKTGSQTGGETDWKGRTARILGLKRTADFIDRYFVDSEKQRAKRKRKGLVDEDEDTTDRGGGAGVSKELVGALGTIAKTITQVGKSVNLVGTRVNTMGRMLVDVSSDVSSIKTLLMPRKFEVKGRPITDDWGRQDNKDTGRQEFVQYNPLAPAGHQFVKLKKKHPWKTNKNLYTMGGPTKQKISKGFMEDAMEKAAMASAIAVLKLQDKKEEKKRGELKKMFEDVLVEHDETFVDPEEKPDEPTLGDVKDELDDVKEQHETFYEKFKKTGFFLNFARMGELLMGMMRVMAWVAGPLFALAIGAKIGSWIWDKYGTQVLDAVFAVKEWFENLDILGFLKPLNENLRKVMEKLHIIKSDEEYAAEEKANAKAGRTRGGVASSKGPSMQDTINTYDKIAQDPKSSVEQRAAAAAARDNMIKVSGLKSTYKPPAIPTTPKATAAPSTVLPPAAAAVTVTTEAAEPTNDAVRSKSRKGTHGGARGRTSYTPIGVPTVTPQSGLKIATPAATDTVNKIGMSSDEWNVYRNTLASIESDGAGGYAAVGGAGGAYDGRYQMGKAAKSDAARILGIKDPGHTPAARAAFRADPALQEKMFAAYTLANHQYLMRDEKYRNLSHAKQIEVLGYAHNQGHGGAKTWLRTNKVGSDAFGTKGTRYSEALAKNLKDLGPTTTVAANALPSKSADALESQNRELMAQNGATGSAKVTNVAPVVVNNNTTHTPTKPMNSNATALNDDSSFVRIASNDVLHPTRI